MTSRTWISRALAAIALLLCLNFAAAIALDPYGLFRDPHDRKLTIVFSARRAKFLLSKRYVPANYDALLIGPSSSENWDPAAIPGIAMYNESILGANVFEEKRIVDQALPTGHFKLALCILTPTMTTNHALEDGLDAVTSAEALGSIHLYIHEAIQILAALNRPSGRPSTANGATPLKILPQNIDAIRYGPGYFQLDPVAVGSYDQMVRELIHNGTRVIYVVPPLYEPCRQLNLSAFDAYKQTMQQTLPPGPVLDLDGPELAGFRADADNYVDCFHVNAAGADKINAYLAQKIPQM